MSDESPTPAEETPAPQEPKRSLRERLRGVPRPRLRTSLAAFAVLVVGAVGGFAVSSAVAEGGGHHGGHEGHEGGGHHGKEHDSHGD